MYNYSTDPFQHVEEVLQANGSLVTNRKTDGFMAQCPAHDDRNPSLSVKRADDGNVLVHCFAGCTTEAICSALGIKVRDLFLMSTTPAALTIHPAASQPSTIPPPAKVVPAKTALACQPYSFASYMEGPNTVYSYLNAEGEVAYENVRMPKPDSEKEFRLRRYDRGGNVIGGLGETLQIPYGLPELLMGPDEVTHVTEGEKDTIALRKRNVLAVSLSDGVLSNPALNQWFGGRHIIVHADNDKAGRSHALRRAEKLYPFVATIRIIEYLELPDKGDVTDYLEGGYGTLDDLIERCNSAPVWHPPSTLPTSGLKLRQASEITPREIDWLWERWLPMCMLTLFAGYGGSGKSATALAIAAALTTGGTLPDGSSAPLTNVLILAAEDSPEYTLVPRLIALGANLERVHFVDGVLRDDEVAGWIQLREHIALIEATVRNYSIGLVIIDPVSSYIGDGNSDRESDVRSALMPVVQMAERTGVAVLMIRHVSKGGDNSRAASRILGSTAWHDVPRVAWMLADAPDSHQQDPNEDGTNDVRRVLGVVKSNLTAKPGARWGVQPADGPFHWLPELSPVSIDDCFRRTSTENNSKVDDAVEWLRERMAGGMQRSRSVEAAARDAGISIRTLQRARVILNVRTRKDKDGWWMGPPPAMTEPNQDRHTATTDNAGEVVADGEQIRHLSSYGAVGDVDAPTNPAMMAELAIFPQPAREFGDIGSDKTTIQDRQPEPESLNDASSKTAIVSEVELGFAVAADDETEEWSLTL